MRKVTVGGHRGTQPLTPARGRARGCCGQTPAPELAAVSHTRWGVCARPRRVGGGKRGELSCPLGSTREIPTAGHDARLVKESQDGRREDRASARIAHRTKPIPNSLYPCGGWQRQASVPSHCENKIRRSG